MGEADTSDSRASASAGLSRRFGFFRFRLWGLTIQRKPPSSANPSMSISSSGPAGSASASPSAKLRCRAKEPGGGADQPLDRGRLVAAEPKAGAGELAGGKVGGTTAASTDASSWWKSRVTRRNGWAEVAMVGSSEQELVRRPAEGRRIGAHSPYWKRLARPRTAPVRTSPVSPCPDGYSPQLNTGTWGGSACGPQHGRPAGTGVNVLAELRAEPCT